MNEATPSPEPLVCSDLPLVNAGGRLVSIWSIVVLVRRACEAVLSVYRKPDSEWGMQLKNGLEPVTTADMLSNQILVEGLKEISPDSLIISEESAQIPYEERKNEEYVWLVDPLDGTKEFIRKNGNFAINVGLCRKGVPILGVVGDPMAQRTYVGGSSIGGSWAIENNLETLKRIRCRPFFWGDKGLRVVASSSHMNDKTADFIEKLNSPTIAQYGSALKFIRVATGEADIYPRFALCSEWDTCAPHAILEAAGGCVLQWPGEGVRPSTPLQYNKPCLLNPFFISMGIVDEIWPAFA